MNLADSWYNSLDGDQVVAKPLTFTEEKQTYIHVSSGIRTQDPSVIVAEEICCLTSNSHCDRPSLFVVAVKDLNIPRLIIFSE
jgi:hypothetical protein